MELSDNNRSTLLLAVHQVIEEQAAYGSNNLMNGRTSQLNYPPNGGFTAEEKEALKLLQGNKEILSAMRKVLASCAATVVFDLLNLIDGTSDPEHGDWGGVALVDRPEDADNMEFLHDEFFSTYWDWRQKRKNKNWRLDLLPD